MIYPTSCSMFQPVQPMFVYFLVPQTQEPEKCLNQFPTCQNKENSQPATIPPGSSLDSRGTDAYVKMEESREIEDDAKLNKIKKEQEEEFIPNMPETNKRRRNSQNENRNVIPNIVHKVFSFMLKNIRSGKMVESTMARLLSQSSQTNLNKCSVERYYLYLKSIKNKINNYVNQDSLLAFNEFHDQTFSVYNEQEQRLYIQICRILILHFLTYEYDLTILTSKRMKPEKKKAHLQAKRRLVEHLTKIFEPTLLHYHGK